MSHVAVENPWAGDTDAGILIQKIQHRFDAPVEDLDVRVEQEHILSAAGSDADIVAFGKAKVFFVFDEDDVGKQGLDHFVRAVRGIIVRDNDFNLARFRAISQAFQTAFEVVLVVVIENDDGNIHGSMIELRLS